MGQLIALFGVASTKIFLIIIGIFCVIIIALSITISSLNKTIEVKEAKIKEKTAEAEAAVYKCNSQKAELISSIKQMELKHLEESAVQAKLNINANNKAKKRYNKAVIKNKKIIIKAKNEQDFTAIWYRINELIN